MPSPTHDRLTQWFQQWRSPLRRFLEARATVRRADVDDVAQEVFLRLLRYERAELVDNPQAYLFKIATNVAAEWSIRVRNRQPHGSQWLADLPAEEGPESEVARAAAELQLSQALAALPPRSREVLKLHFTAGLTHAQIADRLAVTRRIVKRDLISSYGKLRMQLDPEVLDALLGPAPGPGGR